MPLTPSTTNASSTSSTSGSGSKLQSAKNAAKDFLRRDQQHNTEVREIFKPAVVKEVVKPVESETVTTAVDREIHRDHYQTRIQPVEDRVVTEERHHHKVLPVETIEKSHGKDHEIKARLQEEATRFRSTKEVLPTQHETVASGVVAGEHVHHHVHETIQPVIEREVIQPTVIHTTKPIHEKIEHEPIVHPPTVQPKMTLEEFQRAGGSLEGKPEIREVFEGEPQVKENGGAHRTHPIPRSGAMTGTTHSMVRPDMERRNTPPIRGH